MLVSYKWLQNYFEEELPSLEELKEGLTLHSFEIEEVEEKNGDYIIDVDVLPNRAHDCLSHYGIAKEIQVIFGLNIKKEYLKLSKNKSQKTREIKIEIEDKNLCRRYAGRVMENVKVGPSPDWLKEALESIEHKSINNIVDATNFVMFDFGQPMHAFDLDKLESDEINIRLAREGEKIITLDNQKVDLDENILVIADNKDPLAIAGIKGGKKAEVDEKTINIILESANFQSTNIRKTSQKINIQTDSSKRFENGITPEIAEEALERVVSLIKKEAGSDIKVGEIIDSYPQKPNTYKVGVSLDETNKILGTSLSEEKILNIFKRFNFETKKVEDPYKEVVSLANGLIDVPYQSGASITYDAPNLFDCSSLTAYLFAQVGVAIPRISVDQYVFGEEIQKKDLKHGDLIFSNTGIILKTGIYKETVEFLPKTPVQEGVDHCGLYVGDNKVLHTSSQTKKVVIEDLDKAGMFKNIVGYRRIRSNFPRFVVTIPVRRLDLRIKEDLIEEIGRIYGYDNISSQNLEEELNKPIINKYFYYINKIRQILSNEGFSEVYNYTFTNKGEIEVIKPLATDKSFLRANLSDGLIENLKFNFRYADLIGQERLKIFELGKVFEKNDEHLILSIGIKKTKSYKGKEKDKDYLQDIIKLLGERLGSIFKIDIKELEVGVVLEINLDEYVKDLPKPDSYQGILIGINEDVQYQSISQYPFILRDIAIWVPKNIKEEELLKVVKQEAGQLLVRSSLFDRFEKEGRVSYAFKLVFQSYIKTLSDEEINIIMDKVTNILNSQEGWEVR